MRRTSLLFKSTAITSCVAMLTMAMPAWAFAPDHKPEAPKPEAPRSRELSAKELQTRKGKLGENPYMSGSQRYSVNMMGVDLLTMNYSTSATDLSFEGGYGVPVNVTRTYSANEADEGPFGKGWVLSVDIRTTAGGLLKSSAAPDRSVPVHMKQFPIDQKNSDGSFANTERVASTDASGRESNYQLDVDGVFSGPLWDKNVYDSEYEEATSGDNTYSTLNKMKVLTPEGTIYEYEKQGAYDDTNLMQAIPYEGTASTPQPTPSNILKIKKITDRHGNETTFTYTTAEADRAYCQKANGRAWENRLIEVTMPGGRNIDLTWTEADPDQYGTDKSIWRIASVVDGSDSDREVTYDYDEALNLETVTSPEGKTTTYGWGAANVGDSFYSDYGSGWSAGNLLTSITDCRGQITTIEYAMSDHPIPGTDGEGAIRLPTASAYRVTQPNGIKLYVGNFVFFERNESATGTGEYLADYPLGSGFVNAEDFDAQFMVGPDDNPDHSITKGQLLLAVDATDPADPIMVVRMKDTHSSNTTDGTMFPTWRKEYRVNTGDLLLEKHWAYPTHYDDQRAVHGLDASSYLLSTFVESNTTYNFQGNPLEKTIYEKQFDGTTTTTTSTKTVSYAYHGYDKYFQQKAVKDPAGRISYTDYYDSSATDGKKGQVYRVYDPKWSNGYTNSSGTGWKNNIVPSNTALWSAEFDYDTDGRPTSVKKLQSGTVGSSGTYSRVQTVTTYGGSGSPFWGAAATVTEDYGSGKINRVTETIAYDSAGRATVTKDAAGKRFHTVYDLDGRVETVEVDPAGGTSYTPILSYTYGTSGQANGMPTTVVDKTDANRWIEQGITYETSGGGKGQVDSIHEEWISDPGGTPTTTTEYTVSYEYTDNGERSTVIYDSPNGDRSWRYAGYRQVGSPEGAGRAFTELIEREYVSSAWQDSTDRMFYHYDTAGRLLLSAFAGTKKTTGWSGWPDNIDPGWFMHATRAVQENIYDPAGRVLSVANYWQEYNGTTGSGANQVPTYSTSKIADGKVAYEYSSSTGLRSNQKYYDVASGAWSLDHTEEYSYDSSLDYLTGVDYNDGLSNEVQSWSYDAAGNRAGSYWVYDNLNRMTSAAIANGGAIYSSYTNDILGNRTHRNWGANSSSAMTYEWDVLNRAKVIAGVSAGGTYHYRADGQRVEKVTGTTITWVPDAPLSRSGHYDTNYVTNGPSSRYFYDGQMGFEDDYNPSGSVTKINRYALGARGIDRIENYESSTTTYGYPLYDGHGNMRAVLTKSGSTYATGNWRTYDVWGSVRSGSSTADPKQRYVANLGHVADDESGLTYMRARYYEPSTGRFVSEDPSMDGLNWYAYCRNSPLNFVDRSGKSAVGLNAVLFGVGFALGSWAGNLVGGVLFSNSMYVLRCYGVLTGDPAGVDVADRALAIYNGLVVGGLRAIADSIVGFGLEVLGITAGAEFVTAISGAGALGLGFTLGLLIGFSMAMLSGYLTFQFSDLGGAQ